MFLFSQVVGAPSLLQVTVIPPQGNLQLQPEHWQQFLADLKGMPEEDRRD